MSKQSRCRRPAVGIGQDDIAGRAASAHSKRWVVEPAGIEPASAGCKPAALPLSYSPAGKKTNITSRSGIRVSRAAGAQRQGAPGRSAGEKSRCRRIMFLTHCCRTKSRCRRPAAGFAGDLRRLVFATEQFVALEEPSGRRWERGAYEEQVLSVAPEEPSGRRARAESRCSRSFQFKPVGALSCFRARRRGSGA